MPQRVSKFIGSARTVSKQTGPNHRSPPTGENTRDSPLCPLPRAQSRHWECVRLRGVARNSVLFLCRWPAQPPPRYRFHPVREMTLLPSSISPIWNRSHRPSFPAPITRMVWSLTQPMTPLGGRATEVPSAGRYEEAPIGSSPISKCWLAKEYTSENMRGRRGILPRIPHLLVISSAGLIGEALRLWLDKPPPGER